MSDIESKVLIDGNRIKVAENIFYFLQTIKSIRKPQDTIGLYNPDHARLYLTYHFYFPYEFKDIDDDSGNEIVEEELELLETMYKFFKFYNADAHVRKVDRYRKLKDRKMEIILPISLKELGKKKGAEFKKLRQYYIDICRYTFILLSQKKRNKFVDWYRGK